MKEPVIRSTGQVKRAWQQARAIATERGIPLTPERIAACLGISRQTLQRYRDGSLEADSPSELVRARVQDMLQKIWCECNAELAEELLRPGSHSGAVFLGKNNFGYADKAESAAVHEVIFIGEDQIAD